MKTEIWIDPIFLEFLTPFFVILITIFLFILGFIINRRNKRIDNFVDKLSELYDDRKGKGALKGLLPAGINGLENDKEIKIALKKFKQLKGFNPIEDWDQEIKDIGYKKFFNYVVKSGSALQKGTIISLINDCKDPARFNNSCPQHK